MRSILNLATEGFNNGHATPYGNLSREDEEVMMDEANEAAASADAGLEESERMLGISDALEDLAEIADTIPEASEAETQLLTVAGNMAVSGTDVPAEEIVPAMEGFIGRRIATESLRERAAAIWKAIQAQIKKVWAWIEKFFYNIFGTIPGLKKELNALRSRIDDSSSKKQEEKKVTISGGVKALCVDGSAPKNEGDLSKNLSTLLDAVSNVYGKYTDDLASIGTTVAEHIADFDAEKPAESLKSFLGAVEKKLDIKSLGSMSSAGNRFSGFTTMASKPLPGNVSLFYKKPKAENLRQHANADLQTVEVLRHSGVVLAATSDKEKAVPDSFDLATPSASAMHSWIDDMEKLLDKLEDFNRGKRTSEMAKTRQKLEAASEKASKAVEKAEKSDDAADRMTIVYFRAMLNYNQAYAGWCQNPSVQLLQSSLATIRAYKAVISKSLSAYK